MRNVFSSYTRYLTNSRTRTLQHSSDSAPLINTSLIRARARQRRAMMGNFANVHPVKQAQLDSVVACIILKVYISEDYDNYTVIKYISS